MTILRDSSALLPHLLSCPWRQYARCSHQCRSSAHDLMESPAFLTSPIKVIAVSPCFTCEDPRASDSHFRQGNFQAADAMQTHSHKGISTEFLLKVTGCVANVSCARAPQATVYCAGVLSRRGGGLIKDHNALLRGSCTVLLLEWQHLLVKCQLLRVTPGNQETPVIDVPSYPLRKRVGPSQCSTAFSLVLR